MLGSLRITDPPLGKASVKIIFPTVLKRGKIVLPKESEFFPLRKVLSQKGLETIQDITNVVPLVKMAAEKVPP